MLPAYQFVSNAPDGLIAFGEHEALRGGLGHFPGVYLMPLALAHAERLAKFGA